MIPTSSSSSSRGFSLIEVMISTVLLAIGLTATFPLVSYATQRSQVGRRETTALYVGQDMLEKLRSDVRYNIEGGGCTAGGAPLTQSTMWAADCLDVSHFAVNAMAAVEVDGKALPTCGDDGTPFSGIGPFAVEREGELFTVCYLVDGRESCPGVSCRERGTVKVLWRGGNGRVSSRTISTIMQGLQ